MREELEKQRDAHVSPILDDTQILNRTLQNQDEPIKITIEPNITGSREEWQPFIAIIEMRNSQGVTIFLDLQERRQDQTEIELYWMPEQPGDYEIRSFAISGIERAEVLSPVRTFNFTALPDDTE